MNRRAMTLIELLAALVILSAVAAAAAAALREASASARASALRAGAANAVAACPDLPRALLGGALDGEVWPRELTDADGRTWRVSFVLPEPIAADQSIDASTSGSGGGPELDLAAALVLVECREASEVAGWIEAWRFETPVPAPQPVATGARRRPRWRGPRARRRSVGRARGLTLIETLASLTILSMLASMVGVWSSATLRLQRRIADSGQDDLAAALGALRRDLDCARLGEHGPEIRVDDDGASIEIVAPPVGAALSQFAPRPPSWGRVYWSVGRAAGEDADALIRADAEDEGGALVALTGVASMHAEIASSGSSDFFPLAIALRLDWSDPTRSPAEFRWEAPP